MSDEEKNEPLTREGVKGKLAGSSRYMAILLAMTDPALDWLVAHPDELEKVLSNNSEYKSYYLPDELADIVKRPDLKISNKGKQEEKKEEKKSSKSKSKFRVPDFSKVGALENDPFLVNEGEDESSHAHSLRERLRYFFQEIQDYVKKAQNPDLRTSYNDGSEFFEKIGANLGYYRKAREELKEELVQMDKGRSSNAPRFGTYWENRDDFLSGNLNPRDFWKLPKEQAEAINKEAEAYYQSIKGNKELDPDLLGDQFRFSESFYRPIDLVGKYDDDQAFSPILNGVPATLGGLAHFARTQGYLNNLDDPFFTKLVAQQFNTEEDAARDYIGQLSSLEIGDLTYLAGPRGFDDEENFFKRLKVTHDPNYSKNARSNPNRVGAIPEFNSKNPIFSRIFGKKKVTEDQKRAAHAIFSLMIDAPGASKDFILGRAQSLLPNMEAKNLGGIYKYVREYLSGKGIISGDMFRGGAGKNVVDANLRAKEMQGWTDEQKVAEYDRLVGEGLLQGDRMKGEFDELNPNSEWSVNRARITNEIASNVAKQNSVHEQAKELRGKITSASQRKEELSAKLSTTTDGAEKKKLEQAIEETEKEIKSYNTQLGALSGYLPKLLEEHQKLEASLEKVDAGYVECTDDLQKISEINKRIEATLAETEAAINNWKDNFSFSKEAYTYVNPSKAGTAENKTNSSSSSSSSNAEDANADEDVPFEQRVADAYFKRKPTRSAQIRNASKALLHQMLQNPGASMEYIMEKAREMEPTIGKGVFNAPYHDVREFLSEDLKIITEGMNDRTGQKVVDTYLRAKEMSGWTDEQKVAEYDRLVGEGLIDSPKNPKATLWEYVNPLSDFNKQKKFLRGERKKEERRLSDLNENDPFNTSAISETKERLEKIDEWLKKLEEGYATWVSDEAKIKSVNEAIYETLRQTDAQIKDGVGDPNAKFSPDVERIVNASGKTESIVIEGGKRRPKSKRETSDSDAILDKILADNPEARDFLRKHRAEAAKRNAARTTRWTAQGARIGESFGRFFGGGSAKAAASGARIGASLGMRAAGVAAIGGASVGAAAGTAVMPGGGTAVGAAVVAALAIAFSALTKVVKSVVGVFKRLYSATEKAVEKMIAYSQYNSNLFVANMRHRGREYQRNVSFAQGTSKTGAKLLESFDNFKDALNPLLIKITNLINTYGESFLNALTKILTVLGSIIDFLGAGFSFIKNNPVSKGIGWAARNIVSPVLGAMSAPVNLGKAALGSVLNWGVEGSRKIFGYWSSDSKVPEWRQKSEEESEKKRRGVRASEMDIKRGDYTAYDADEATLSATERKQNKELAKRFAWNRGINLASVQDSPELRHDLANIQDAQRDLQRGDFKTMAEVVSANAGRGIEGALDVAAGIIDGEAATKEAKEKLIEIGLNNGKDVEKNGEWIRKRGELARRYYESGGDISQFSKQEIAEFEKATGFMGGAFRSLPFGDYYLKRNVKNFLDNNRGQIEDDIAYSELVKGGRSTFAYQTISADQLKNHDLREIILQLEDSNAKAQLTNERLADLGVSNNQIAKNTAKEDQKDKDPVFNALSTFVEQNKEVKVPSAFADANKEAQYGRFAGREKTQLNWGLK